MILGRRSCLDSVFFVRLLVVVFGGCCLGAFVNLFGL